MADAFVDAWSRPERWSEALGLGPVRACRFERLHRGYSPSRIYRVWLDGGGGPASVVAKVTQAPWPDTDPQGLHREWQVYERGGPALEGVGARCLYSEVSAGGSLLVLEDMETEHIFRDSGHRWSPVGILPVIEALAVLHTQAEALALDRLDLLMPGADRRWDDAQIVAAAECLQRLGGGHGLAATAEKLLDWQARQRPCRPCGEDTLLHCDINTGNVALPKARGPARLIDWHIAGRGPAAFDVASLFFQPHFNHRRLAPDDIIRQYAAACRRLQGDGGEFGVEAFHYGMAADGLSYLPPVAGQWQRTGALEGWWGHMLHCIAHNLRWVRRRIGELWI